MFVTESETKLGLGQNGAKPVRLLASDKQESKSLKKVSKSPEGGKNDRGEEMRTPPNPSGKKLSSSVSNQERLLRSTYSMNATCSNDASSDSFHSRASTGGIIISNSIAETRKKQCKFKTRSLSRFSIIC